MDWTASDKRAETINVSACYALAKVSSKLYGLHPGTRIAALTADAEITLTNGVVFTPSSGSAYVAQIP